MNNKIKERLDQLEILISESAPQDIIEEKFYSIKRDFDEIKDYLLRNGESVLVSSIDKRLNQIPRECDFYDAEGELDMMFPNRHDEDFDEDSYSNMYDD